MQTYSNVNDPLDRELDFSHMKIEKAPYKFSLKEKINVWLDTLYDGVKLSKDNFYNEVENSLKEFCNK